MKNKICLIGHRDLLPEDIEIRLFNILKEEIENGAKYFTMGTHGEFDIISLHICKKLKKVYKDIEIEIVLTSLNQIKPYIEEDKYGKYIYTPYQDVSTIMYDIENIHFKNKITASNKKMIDTCSKLICYVNPKKTHSGAKLAMNHAKKHGLTIINLFKIEDDFFYKKSKEVKMQAWNDFKNNRI